jgi:hypothetical protein
MPLPPTAFIITAPIDPADIADSKVVLTQEGDTLPAGQRPLLEAGEAVESYTLTPTAEAVAAGLIIKEGGGYETTLAGKDLRFWLEVDPSFQGHQMFNGEGQTFGIELTVLTTSSPQRRKQRTIGVKVANQ